MVPGMIAREIWEEPGWRIGEHTNSRPQPWDMAEYIVIHYTAAPKTAENYDEVLRRLQQSQRSYAENRGYSYGYNWMCDRQGRVWEIRGDDYRCAANGNTESNSKGPAILCLVNGAEAANWEMTQAVRRVVDHCQHRAGAPLKIVCHSDVRATQCPGDGLRAQVRNDTFRPIQQELEMQIVNPPIRLLDTRQTSQRLKDGGTIAVPIGVNGARAAFVNITSINPAKSGYLTAWSGGGSRPTVSNLNYGNSGVVCNTSWVPVSPQGTISIYAHIATDLVVDLQATA